ncbi:MULTISPECIES: phage major capsid protein [Bacillus cereus group]|uniref:phage major capsid protein n=1 Tax=Bacillus cereus group TaxID=86661 RepID=UPI0018CFC89E|nr:MULTISPECIES: phage major capsid protein [Bacillus cereus group]MBG9841782.1 major capsid protein [Bacillus tropicus]MBG9879080.1 major capsid protein [Bacillus tropicus]MBG9923203.1 major capsid protein [Bacillus tropicus]MBJ8356176.1 phage capsid protein [Bacillus mycoides]MED2903821.1 phage major capsid protein [Bacillus tropicus]
MTIKNLDREAQKQNEMREKLLNAMNSGDEEQAAAAMVEFANSIQQNIINEARQAVNEDLSDQQVMVSRGLQVLTKDEQSYYNEVIANKGFAGTETLVPATVFERVFEYLRVNHALLNHIQFVNTTGVTQWVVKKGYVQSAWWGKLCEEIKELLDDGFEVIATNLYKLSAYVPICNAMLDLGPIWLDRYVREILAESMAIALEEAIVNGTGKDQPIGMMKDLKAAVTNGVYSDKTATPLTDLTPTSLGKEVMAPLTNGGRRAVGNALMIVNPLDYWEKIFPATTFLTQNGAYVSGVLPIPATVIQSLAVPKGKMVAGIASDYFMGVGSTQKMESSKEYRFLEDETVYLSKQYANGRPKDNDSFLVFDISALKAGDKGTTTP